MAKAPAKGLVGINPQKMAQSMTDLAYNAQAADIANQIAQNQGQEANALRDIQAWADQIGTTYAQDAAASGKAWDQAQATNAASDQNITQLFGGNAAPDAAGYAGIGQGLLGALGASDKAFNERMQPILKSQGASMAYGAQNKFNAQDQALKQRQTQLSADKANAYNQNLVQMMQLQQQGLTDQWQHQAQLSAQQQANKLLPYQIAEAKLRNQAARLNLKAGSAQYKAQLAQNKQNLTLGGQKITLNQQQIQQGKTALAASNVQLKALQDQYAQQGKSLSTLDWNNPGAANAVTKSIFAGSVDPKTGTFAIRPDLAFANAMQMLQVEGWNADPRAVSVVVNAFDVLLRTTHGHGKFKQYQMTKHGVVNVQAQRNKAAAKAAAKNQQANSKGSVGNLTPGQRASLNPSLTGR